MSASVAEKQNPTENTPVQKTAQEPAQEPVPEPAQKPVSVGKSTKDKEGPCGLPTKCSVS